MKNLFTTAFLLILYAAAFSQIPQTELALWIRADTLVTSAGGNVSAWGNCAGGPGFTSLAGDQPVLVANAFNGKPALSFNGVSDFMSAGNNFNIGTQSHTVFLVGTMTNGGNDAAFFAKSGSADLSNRYSLIDLGTGVNVLYDDENLSLVAATSTNPAALSVYSNTIDRNQLLISLYVNGALQGSSSNIQGPSYNFTSTTRFLLGAYNSVGDGATLFYLAGDIAEMIIYDTILNTAQRQGVEQYLQAKYSKQIALGPDTVLTGFCPLTLNAGAGFTGYKWSTGVISTQSISVTQSGTYWVSAYDALGYVTSDTIKVTYPGKFPLPDTFTCLGSPVIINPGLTGSYNYTWSTGATTPTVSISKQNTYTLSVTGAGACARLDTFTVAVDSFSYYVSLKTNDSLCSGNTLALKTGAQLVNSYAWSTMATSPSIVINASGSYSVTVTDIKGCVVKDTSVVTIIGTAPTVNFSFDTVCQGAVTQFTGQAGISLPAHISSYLWNLTAGSTSSSLDTAFVFPASGTYNVTYTATSNVGCSGSVVKAVPVKQNPVASILPLTQACINNPYLFSNNSSAGPGDSIISFNWSFGDNTFSSLANPAHSYTGTGNKPVMLSVSSLLGCSASVTDTLQVVATAALPGSFTLITPFNNFSSLSNSFSFLWNAATNASNYTLEVSTDSTFANVTYSFPGLTTRSYTLTVDTAQSYFWRVLANNSCGAYTASPVRKVTYVNLPAIPGLSLWLRADSLITSSSSNISAWGNSAGGGVTFTSPTGSQPKLVPGVLNGKPVVRFDGVSTYMTGGNNFNIGSNSRNMFIVVTSNNAAPPYAIFAKSDLTQATNRYGFLNDGSNFYVLYEDAALVQDIVPAPVAGSPSIYSNVVDRNQLQTRLYVNGVLGTTVPGIQGPSYNFTSPTRFLLGAYDNTTDNGQLWNLQGDIAEMIIYDSPSPLSDTTRKNIEQYLHFKYAPQINLGPDTTIPFGFCAITLNAGAPFTNYRWSTGATTASISVNQSGTYWVSAYDIFGYVTSDTIKVTYPGKFPLPDTSTCFGVPVTVNPGLSAAYTFRWSTGASTPTVNITNEGTYMLTVTGNGCSVSDAFTLTVDSFSTFVSLGANANLCSGNPLALKSGASLVNGYLWSTGAITPATVISNTGNYSVTVNDIRDCIAKDTVFITVLGTAPTVNFTNDTVCQGITTNFTSQASVPSGSITSYSWDFMGNDTSSSANPAFIFPASGVYNVTFTASTSAGCNGSVVVAVPVKQNPVASFLPLTQACINNPYLFFNNSSAAPGDSIVSYSWAFGDNTSSSLASPSHTYTSIGNESVSLSVSSLLGCSASFSNTLQVVATAALPGPVSLVSPLNNFSSVSPAIIFSWNPVTNAANYTLQISVDTFFSTVTYNIAGITTTSYTPSIAPGYYYWRVLANNSCGYYTTSAVQQVSYVNLAALPGLTVWLRADSLVTADASNNVSVWGNSSDTGINFTQPTTGAQPRLIPNVLNGKPVIRFNGTTDFMSAGNNFNIGTNSRSVFLVAEANNSQYAFFAKTNGTGAIPLDNRYSLVNDGTNFYILFDDVGLERVITPTPPAAGVNYIYSSVADRNQQLLSLFVNGNQAGSKVPGIQGPSYNFTSTTRFLLGAFDSANDSSTVFNLNGDIAELIIYDSAIPDSVRVGIEQYLRFKYAPQINLGPDITVPYGVCNTTLNIGPYFANVRWSTGDTSTYSIVVKQGGTYWASGIDIFGYPTSDTVRITMPYHGASVGNNAAICLYDSLLIYQKIQPPGAYSFLWQDGSTSDSIYAKTPGQYYTQITDTNHCVLFTDTLNIGMDSFQVQTILSDTSVCSGNEIGAVLNSYQPSAITWSTGDSTAAIVISTPGTYSVTVTDINSCVAKGTAQVEIHGHSPTVNFKVQNLCENDSTRMTDLSVPVSPDKISSWQWSFGDGDNSTTQNPAHSYTQIGDFDIQLYILTDSGCSGVKTVPVFISPSPLADFSYPSVICAGTTSPFFNTSSILLTDTIAQYLWVFNSVDSFYTPDVVYSFPTKGDVPVKLVVTSKEGCTDSVNSVIDVFAALVANFEAANVCYGDSTAFIDITHSFSVVSWQWNFGDGSFFSTLQNPVHEYASTGNYDVKLTIVNAIGCIDTISKLVSIVEPPTAAFTNLIACVNSYYSPVDSSISPDEPITHWDWNINGKNFNTETPSYYFSDTGIYKVKLTVTSKSGCTDSTSNLVTIYPAPTAAFIYAPLYGAAPLTVNFTDESTGAVSFAWNFGDGSPGSFDESPTYTYTQNDTFNIVLSVASAYGCTDSSSKILIVSQTYLDLSVDVVQAKTVIQPDGSSLVSITANMSNLGTRLITDITLQATLGSGGVISEEWSGVFPSGTIMDYTFASQFVIGASFEDTYVCVDAVSVNDGETETRTDNNIQCATLTGGIQLVGPSPNPAYENASLGIILPEAGQVTIDVSDIAGKFIAHNVVLNLAAGRTDYLIPAGQMAAGQYILRLQYNDNIYTRRFVVQ